MTSHCCCRCAVVSLCPRTAHHQSSLSTNMQEQICIHQWVMMRCRMALAEDFTDTHSVDTLYSRRHYTLNTTMSSVGHQIFSRHTRLLSNSLSLPAWWWWADDEIVFYLPQQTPKVFVVMFYVLCTNCFSSRVPSASRMSCGTEAAADAACDDDDGGTTRIVGAPSGLDESFSLQERFYLSTT